MARARLRSAFDMPSWLYWGGMAAIVLLSLLYSPRPRKPPATETAVS